MTTTAAGGRRRSGPEDPALDASGADRTDPTDLAEPELDAELDDGELDDGELDVGEPDGAGSEQRPGRLWGLVLVIGSALGFVASMVLTIDRIAIAANPEATFACDISPFVACGPAMTSAAGEIFGFPNPLLGIAGFAISGTTGVLLAAGMRPPRWYLACLQVGVVGAAVLITFLQYQTVGVINAICLWCTLVWAVTIPIVVTTTVSNLRLGTFGAGAQRVGRALQPWQGTIVLAWYVVVLSAIALRFYRDFALFWFGVSL